MGFGITAYRRHFPSVPEYFPAEIAQLAPIIEDGLVTVDDCGMQVHNKGRLLIHRVCMVFDEYLKKARRKPAGENLASFCQMLAEK